MAALIAYILFSVLCLPLCCIARETITPDGGLQDGDIIVSQGGKFALGFFSPLRSSNRYLGLWFTSESEHPVPVVWVANRATPVNDTSGSISINENGSLVLTDGRKNPLWSTPAPSNASRNSAARLLDTGNLVLRDSNTEDYIWESFDDPDHALVPNMKLRIDVNTNRSRFLHSWKDVSDPSVGQFSLGISPLKPYQVLIWNNSELHWRSGPWTGRAFLGVPGRSSFYLQGMSFTVGGGSVNFKTNVFDDTDSINRTLYMLNSTGNVEKLTWDADSKAWFTSWTPQTSDCDVYGKCGPFGVCNPLASPICSCFRGFEPRLREEWNKDNWSGGCVRKNPLSCEASKNGSAEKKEDGFLKLENMKPPDSIAWLSFEKITDGCERACLRNCSCVAYAFDAGIGCMFWEGGLKDIQKFHVDGVDLYIRLPTSELGDKKQVKVIVTVLVVGGATLMGVFMILVWRWHSKQRGQSDEAKEKVVENLDQGVGSPRNRVPINFKKDEGPELPIFDFKVVSIATDNFSLANKLGEGGFGPVYKGILPTGQEVAVKRLSKSSGQGMREFRNEVVVISRVQHKNLVRLLGYCVQQEKMLVYEYMPNKSLDAYIFDSDDQPGLDWAQRFHIIEGIARGLLYLHRDSRMKIVHRDLKASNILLDRDLNPKISDFGLARIFEGNQIEDETRRVVGTYGYMSPEYAMQGQFSEKSDVFSFGVLLLEIVSGKRNTGFYNHEDSLNLLGHVWKLWNEGKALELVDSKLGSSYSETEALRCIRVGLLCVQEFAADRPSTSATTLFLSADTVIPLTPKQPAFVVRSITTQSSSSEGKASINDVTVTKLQGR